MRLPSGVVGYSDVVVVGAGPTGLALACELAMGGTDVRLLEERVDKPNITRAFALHARTLELPDAILVRPDGYVAWASDRMPTAAEVLTAVSRWTVGQGL